MDLLNVIYHQFNQGKAFTSALINDVQIIIFDLYLFLIPLNSFMHVNYECKFKNSFMIFNYALVNESIPKKEKIFPRV